jgi:serine protease Do
MIGTQAETLKNRRDARFWVQLSMAMILASFLMLASSAAVSHAASPNAPLSFSDVAKKVSDEVVNIKVVSTTQVSNMQGFQQYFNSPWGQNDSQNDSQNDFFERFYGDSVPEYEQDSLGSGFIVGEDGYIVTNNHVVDDADDITVTLKNGKEYPATVVGKDENTDIALIKIEPDEPLKVAEMGDSDALEVGDWVVAIGSPFGYEQTITAGIISAKGRVINAGPYDDFLQTDASINPGNSGGPLIDMNGQVIGINTAIVDIGTGIGFAIPINMAKGVVAQLKNNGSVTRGWLGVSIQDLEEGLAEYYGVKDKKGAFVANVTEGDPADKAGIQANDVIVTVNGEKIEDSRDLTRVIADIPVGDIAKIEVIRNGKTKKFKVEIGKRTDTVATSRTEETPRREEPSQGNLGIQVTELTQNMAQRYNLSGMEGVMVTRLSQNGKAATAGLQTYDIIQEINHQEIKSLDDYSKAMNSVKDNETISMKVYRSSAGYMVVIIEP